MIRCGFMGCAIAGFCSGDAARLYAVWLLTLALEMMLDDDDEAADDERMLGLEEDLYTFPEVLVG